MKRRLFNLLAALSLLLCVATVVLWVRSYWRSDALVYNGRQGHRAVQWARGMLIVCFDNVGSPHPGFGLDSWSADRMNVRIGSGLWCRFGFGQDLTVTQTSRLSARTLASFANPPPPTLVMRRISLPLWVPVVFSLVLPGRAARIGLRRRRRRNAMQCVVCGYDLRATPQRCPECGTTTSAQQN